MVRAQPIESAIDSSIDKVELAGYKTGIYKCRISEFIRIVQTVSVREFIEVSIQNVRRLALRAFTQIGGSWHRLVVLGPLGWAVVLYSAGLAYADPQEDQTVSGRYFDDAPLQFSPSLAQSPMYTLDGLTDWGQDLLYVYGLTTLITIIVFLCVSLPIIYVLIRFRDKSAGGGSSGYDDSQPLPKQVKGNTLLEIIWTTIPIVLLVLIAIPTWQTIFRQDRAVKHIEQGGEALKVEVIGHQWWWEFVYTDFGVTTANELVLPERTPVIFSITSADVIHSFYIPKFGGKLDAIPGKVNRLVYTTPALSPAASVTGEYYTGQCMELCGLSHALMKFEAVIRSEADFKTFIDSHNVPPVVNTASEQRGEQVFNQCMACHDIAGTPSAELPVAKIGPNLSNFGDRRTLAAGIRRNSMVNLKAWIKNPMQFKPGALMPALELTDQQIEDVAAYIQFSTAKTPYSGR